MCRVIGAAGISVWQCAVCGKQSTGKGDIKRHVEASHLEHPGITCNICGKVSKTRNALRNHIYMAHNNKIRVVGDIV